MATIHCEAKLLTIGSWSLVRLPEHASAQLPSRGMSMVEGTINGVPLCTALEPDGRGSHWFQVDPALREAARVGPGDTIALAIEPTSVWPEPDIPADLQHALADDPQAYAQWKDITPAARWDWLRWVRAPRQPQTRARRIAVACSKLKQGERRPCCFNRSLCTEPDIATNGVLLAPDTLEMGSAEEDARTREKKR